MNFALHKHVTPLGKSESTQQGDLEAIFQSLKSQMANDFQKLQHNTKKERQAIKNPHDLFDNNEVKNPRNRYKIYIFTSYTRKHQKPIYKILVLIGCIRLRRHTVQPLSHSLNFHCQRLN